MLVIHRNFVLFLAIFKEVLCHHDTSFELTKQNQTISSVKNCCVAGRYDIETQSCIGKDKKIYPFSMLCRELVPLSSLEEEYIDPETVDNACIAEIYSEKKIITKEYFLCDEYENCCTSGHFNPNTSTCVGATTAKYTFTLFCRKFILDQWSEERTASLTPNEKYYETLFVPRLNYDCTYHIFDYTIA